MFFSLYGRSRNKPKTEKAPNQVGVILRENTRVFHVLHIFVISSLVKYGKYECFRYYLKHEHECFIRYKMRGAAKRFIADRTLIASVLNSLKKDPFYTHLVTLFTKEFSI